MFVWTLLILLLFPRALSSISAQIVSNVDGLIYKSNTFIQSLSHRARKRWSPFCELKQGQRWTCEAREVGRAVQNCFVFFEVPSIPDFEHNVAFELIDPVMLRGNEQPDGAVNVACKFRHFSKTCFVSWDILVKNGELFLIISFQFHFNIVSTPTTSQKFFQLRLNFISTLTSLLKFSQLCFSRHGFL